MSFSDAQFAYDYAEEPWNEIHQDVYDEAERQFADDWMACTEFGDKTMEVLTKIAQGEKVDDLEMQAFKNELKHAYQIALEHFTDDNIERIEKEMRDAANDY